MNKNVNIHCCIGLQTSPLVLIIFVLVVGTCIAIWLLHDVSLGGYRDFSENISSQL